MLSSSSSFFTSCINNPAKRRKINDLSEDIIQEILSRVSAKDVLRCRSVCRMWKDLTSPQYFGELHHRNRNRNYSSDDFTILVEEMSRPGKVTGKYIDDSFYKLGKKLYMFDGWRWRGEKQTISPRPDYSYIDAYENDDQDESAMYLSGSSCGLIVLYHKTLFDKQFSRNLSIMNPIFPDNMVKIRVAEDAQIIGQIFGVFFHPFLKEFCLLWGQTRRPQRGRHLEVVPTVEGYKLLNLGPSQSRWRNINNESTSHILKQRQQPRIENPNYGTWIEYPNYGTMGVSSPIVLDDVLYWMAEEHTQLVWPNPNPKFCEEAILGFDTKTEEFHLLPHPAPCACCSQKNLDEMIIGVELFFNEERRAMLLRGFQRSMQLFENNNHLSLCQFSKANGELLVSIWIFKKEGIPGYNMINKGSWIKTHMIKLNDHDDDIIPPTPVPFRNDLIPMVMLDEELLLVRIRPLGYLFVWNLKLGTCERFESKRGSSDDNNPVGGICGTFMCAHTHTLMPIRNSKPEIFLEEL